MRIKYKTQTTRYRAKLKKAEPLKAVITTPYQLSEEELTVLKKQFPQIAEVPIEQVINPALIAGLVIKIGTKRIDLSLSSGLHNLKQYLYDQS